MGRNIIIVLAGGVGARCGSETPKQFRVLNDLPVLMHTLYKLHTSSLLLEIILVLNHKSIDLWRSLCEQYSFSVPHTIVEGGKERFDSSLNAIKCLSDMCLSEDSFVGIHDGVRPFLNEELLISLYSNAAMCGAVVPALASSNPVRQEIKSYSSLTLDRSGIFIVQTPQVFAFKILRDAYFAQRYQPVFYDDATVVEAYGVPVRIVKGLHQNIKITFPLDFLIAKAIVDSSDLINE